MTNSRRLPKGSKVTVAGYGIQNDVDLTGDYHQRFVEVSVHSLTHSASEILIDQDHGRGACYGDSGGPVLFNEKGTWKVMGVISVGLNADDRPPGPRHCDYVALATKVSSYAAWIQKTSLQLVSEKR